MRALSGGFRRGRWLTWTAVPAAIGLGVITLYPLGSSWPEQAPPPIKTGKCAASLFPARGQP